MLLAALGAGPALAQEPAATPAPAAPTLLQALDLPRVAMELRDHGVPEAEVRSALQAARERGLPPAEAAEALDEAADAVRAHGPVDNFGAFVQARLEEGLRGQELAAAIRAEHEARGKGRPADEPGKGQGQGQGQGQGEKGPPDDRGNPARGGGDEAPGGPPAGEPGKGEKGRPAEAGPGAGAGKGGQKGKGGRE